MAAAAKRSSPRRRRVVRDRVQSVQTGGKNEPVDESDNRAAATGDVIELSLATRELILRRFPRRARADMKRLSNRAKRKVTVFRANRSAATRNGYEGFRFIIISIILYVRTYIYIYT